MLNDEIIDRLSESLVKRIEEGNEFVIREISKKIKKIKGLSSTEAHKLQNILKYGGDYEKIVNKLSKITKKNKQDIYKIFEEVAKKDYKFEKQFYDYRNIKYIPYEKNEELKNLVNGVAKITANNYENIANSTNIGLGIVDKKTGEVVFKKLKTAYNELIDEAILNVVTGKETFDTMMKRSVNELGGGLKVLYEYTDKNGVKRYYKKSLDSAVRQNMNDGLSQLQQQMQEKVGKEFDSDGVEITVVYNPAPDHAEVQGKQFSTVKPSEDEMSEFQKFQNDVDCRSYDGTFFSAEYDGRDRRSIGQYNCRHLVYSIILGVNKPQYSDEELKKIIDDNNKGFTYNGKHYTMYEGSQLQRKLESEIRNAKYEQISAVARNNEDDINKAQTKIRLLNKEYKELNKASGLRSREDRLRVSGYRQRKVNLVDNSKVKPTVDLKYTMVEQLDESKFTDYGKDVEKVFKEWYEPYKEKTDNLTNNQKSSLSKICHEYYGDIQNYILGDPHELGSSFSNKELQSFVNDIDSVLDNNEIGKDVVLYRGTLSKYYDKYKIGDDIDTQDLYTFCSLNKGIGCRFCQNREQQLQGIEDNKVTLLKILTPKDVNGFYTDWVGVGEDEIILSRKTRYKYLRKEKIKDTSYFKGEKELEQIVLEAYK